MPHQLQYPEKLVTEKLVTASSLTRRDIAFLICAISIFLYCFREWPSSSVYFYDEADYMQAASSGLVNNILERPSMPLTEFLKVGFSQGLDSSKRGDLSQLVRSRRDITFFRHYHGPLYFYYLSSIAPFTHGGEYAERAAGLLFHLLTFAAIYCGVLLIAGSRLAAGISSFLFLFSSSDLGTATQITPHVTYYCTVTLTLLAFARFLQVRDVRWWYAAVTGFALSVCSIEYSVLLPVTFAICFWRIPESRILSRSVLWRSVLLFLIVLAVVWPAGVFELSAIKSYFFFAHAILKKTGNYGEDTFISSWMKRMALSPPEYAIDAVCVVLAIIFYRRIRVKYLVLPMVLYAGLMFLTTIKNKLLSPTYTSSIMPALAIVSGVVIAQFLSRWKPAAQITIVLVVMAILSLDGARQLQVRTQMNQEPGTAIHALIDRLQADGLSAAPALVPYELLPTISYYLPRMQLTSYLADDAPPVILSKLQAGGSRTLIYVDHDRKPGIPVSAASLRSDQRSEETIGAMPGLGQVTIFRAVTF